MPSTDAACGREDPHAWCTATTTIKMSNHGNGSRVPPAVKLPQLKRLKETARNANEVRQKLGEIGGPTTTQEYALVISTFSKLREWRECAQLIDDMQRQRLQADHQYAVCYSQAISACDKAKQWQKAVELLDGMLPSGVPPNEFHYSAAISACAKCSQSELAMDLLNGMQKAGVKPNEVVYNTALAACTRGDHAKARSLLDEMKRSGVRPSCKSYSAAIGACGPPAWREALSLLDEMHAHGLQADTVCFNSAISCVGALHDAALHDAALHATLQRALSRRRRCRISSKHRSELHTHYTPSPRWPHIRRLSCYAALHHLTVRSWTCSWPCSWPCS